MHFKNMGLGAEDMFNMLINGAESGTFSVDKLGDAVKEFGIRVKDGTANDAFKQLGLSVDETTAKFGKGGESAKQALSEVTTALFNIKDPIKQNQLGVQLFGTMWEDLGAEGVKALMDISGNVDVTKDKLGEINKVRYNDLGSALEGLKRTFQEALSPAIDVVVSAISGLVNCFNSLPGPVKTTIAVIAAIVGVVVLAVVVFGQIGLAISGLSTLFPMISGAIGIFTGALGAISLPAIGVVAAIAAVIAIGVLLYKNWDTIKQYAITIWNAIKDAVGNALEGIKTVVTAVWNFIGPLIIRKINEIKAIVTIAWNIIKAVTTSVWNGIKTVLTTVWNFIKTTVTNRINSVKTVITTVWNAVKSVTTTVWNTLKSTISNAVNKVKSVVQTGFNAVKNNIINPIKSAYSTVQSVFSNIYNTIRNKINSAKQAVSNALSGIRSALVNFKPSWSIPKPKLPHISVSVGHKQVGELSIPFPQFSVSWNALGGIFKKPTIFATPNGMQGVGEAGSEAILPLNSFYNHLDSKLEMFANSSKKIDIDYDKLSKTIIQSLAKSNQGIYMNGELVGIQTADSVKRQNTKSENRLNRLGGVLDNV